MSKPKAVIAVAGEDILYLVTGARPRRRQTAANGAGNEESFSQPEAGGAINEAPDSALATP
jgi:hypothetical protein